MQGSLDQKCEAPQTRQFQGTLFVFLACPPGSFYELGVLFLVVLVIRALIFGAYIAFWLGGWPHIGEPRRRIYEGLKYGSVQDLRLTNEVRFRPNGDLSNDGRPYVGSRLLPKRL